MKVARIVEVGQRLEFSEDIFVSAREVWMNP